MNLGMFLYEDLPTVDRLIRAKATLYKGYPFFAHILYRMKILSDPDVPQDRYFSLTTRGTMRCNDKRFAGLEECYVDALLCNAVLHLLYRHFEGREYGEDPLFLLAADVKTNEMLQREKLYIPPDMPFIDLKDDTCTLGGYTIRKVSEKSHLDIYEELRKAVDEGKMDREEAEKQIQIVLLFQDPEQQEKKDPQPGQEDQAEDQSQEKGQDNGGDESDLPTPAGWVNEFISAAMNAKAAGHLPGGLERLINEILEPKLSWKLLLRRFFSMAASQGRKTTWKRPNRRFRSQGYYFPSSRGVVLKGVLHVDDSGSMWDAVTLCMSEIWHLLNTFSEFEFHLLLADATVQKHMILRPENKGMFLTEAVTGFGGTSHRPVVEWINENEPNCRLFVSLTDGISDVESCYDELPQCCHRLILLPDADPERQKTLQEYAQVAVIRPQG